VAEKMVRILCSDELHEAAHKFINAIKEAIWHELGNFDVSSIWRLRWWTYSTRPGRNSNGFMPAKSVAASLPSPPLSVSTLDRSTQAVLLGDR
jgi:hypothetical protein